MGDDGHQVTGRRSPRPRTPDPPAAAKEIEFGLPTPTTPCFGFRDRGNGSEDDWGISAQLTVTTSQSDPVRLSPAWRNLLDEDLVNDAGRAGAEVGRPPTREPFSSGKQQESRSNLNSPPESSIPKPSRRSRRLAILAKQRASDQKPLELRAPRQSLRIALKGSKAPAPKRPDLTAVRKASQQGTVSTKPTRESRRGQQGQKKTPAMRRDFHQALLRQVLPQEDSQVHTSQTKALEAVPPRSWQAIPANEDVALRPALAVFSVPLSHSDGPPESSTRLEPWEVSPRCIRDGSERIAFSTAALTGLQETRIGPNLGFHVLVLKPGNSHRWLAIPNRVRLCSLAVGKISVKMAGRSFAVGPQGLLKIGGGVECAVQNKLYSDAVLHVCAIADE